MRIAAVTLLAFAACSCGTESNVPANKSSATDPGAQAADPVTAVTEPAIAADESAATVPAALHGRWGLVPGDCTSTRGDAKGLVTISAGEIRFYESVAKPTRITERTDTSIRGEFDFTGEGMEWTKPMVWSAVGDTLTRVGSAEDSRLVYTRC